MAQDSDRLTASQEDYLEAILHLAAGRGSARVRDIAGRLGVAMPSVTRALRSLGRRGLVGYAPYERARLTARGRRRAEGVRRQHRVLRRFLTDVLGVEERAANANACRMEHAVDGGVLERLRSLEEFFASRSPAARAFRAEFRRFCRRSSGPTAGADGPRARPLAGGHRPG